MTAGPAGVEVVDLCGIEELAALRPRWAALSAASAGATPFQAPEWMLPWTRTFAPTTAWGIAVHRGADLVGLAGFYLQDLPGDGRRQLTMLGNGVSDYLGVLAADGETEAVAQAVLDRLRRAGERWDCCDLRDLAADCPLLALARPGARAEISEEEPCPVATLPPHPTPVVASLDRRTLPDILRRGRRLAERGEVALRTVAAEDGRREALAALVALHQKRWSARGLPGVFADPRVRSFHEEASRELMARGALRLYLLELDGQPIAAHYAILWRDRLYAYIHAFDPEFSAFAPGAQLMAACLQAAAAEGARSIDFLRGREPYKYQWGAVDRPKRRLRLWT